MVDANAIVQKGIENLALYLPKVVGAILVLLIGLWIINIFMRVFDKRMSKSKLEASLRHFLVSLTSVALKVLLVITVVSMLGIQMTSFIAVLGAAGLAVGLALQGSLSNFAGGVIILIFKPFKVGDIIEAQGKTGKVKMIQVFSTILTTPDNKTVVIPNGGLSNDTIVNYSTEKLRRVDMIFGIGYDDDIEKSRKIIQKLIDADKRILSKPSPAILVKELADSSVNFAVRVWVNNEDYWNVYFSMTEAVKKEFDKEKISIPYPQRDVHLYNH